MDGLSNALNKMHVANLMMSGERMLQAALVKKGLDDSKLEEELTVLLMPVKEFADTLPQDDASALKLYKDYVGDAIWEGISKNPIVLNLALAHRDSLLAPKIKEMYENIKAWIDDAEFTEEHFNLMFGG